MIPAVETYRQEQEHDFNVIVVRAWCLGETWTRSLENKMLGFHDQQATALAT